MTLHRSKLLAFILSCCFAVPALSASREAPQGYALDSQGNVLTDSYGNCVRSGIWTKEMATVVGCDGYTEAHNIKFVRGEAIEGAVVRYALPFNKLFGFDKAEVSDEGKAYMKQSLGKLSTRLADAYSVTVIGHTDSSGEAQYNYDLSKRRANSVAEYMTTLGVDPGKIRILGVGSDDPIASNETKEGRALNRRAELLVVGQPKAMDRMVFPSVALFERRKANLVSGAEDTLRQNLIKARAQFDEAALIEIVGHTDDVGTHEYNDELSLERAETVANFLIDMGVSPNRIIAIGAGKRSPIASNATDQGRQENRRVEVLVLGRSKS